MTEMTQWWMENGLGTNIAPLKVAAAMGEGPDLSDDELRPLLRTVVNAAGPDAVVICALKAKNTLHTIEDGKMAQDLGAIGLQIDLPFFHHSNQDDFVRHFTDISDGIDIGIMIYNTYWFCQDPVKESASAESMLRLRDAEHVTAIKWGVPDGEDFDQMSQFSHIFNVIDNSGQTVRAHKLGARGYISPWVAAYPPHDLGVWQLLEAHRYEDAQTELDRVRGAIGPWAAKAGEKSGGYRQPKAVMAAMGHPVGPPRPPTLPADDEEISEIKGILKGIGWPVSD
jgi:4-hydroxy-tetrahydrodipicolinate synthase